MSVGYYLINKTKKEIISYLHLPVNTAKEITGNPVTSAITTWYLIKNSGDAIEFVSDQYYLKDISWLDTYKDLTEDIINELIDMKILTDNEKQIFDENEPYIYIRKLKNIWI